MGAPSGRHVEEVIVEPLVTRHVRRRSLRAGPEEPQQHQRSLDCVGADHPPPLDADRIGRQRKADGRDTRWSTRLRSVRYEAIRRIGLVQKVRERVTLQRVQPRFPKVRVDHVLRGPIRHRCSANAFDPITSARAISTAPLSRYGMFICQTKSAPPTSGPLACPRLFAAFWAPSAVPALLPPRVEIKAERFGAMRAMPSASRPTTTKTDSILLGIIRTVRLVPIKAKPMPIWPIALTRPA